MMRYLAAVFLMRATAIVPEQETQHIDFGEYWSMAIGNRWEYLHTFQAMRCVDAQQVEYFLLIGV
jgi:hypothetical protein